MEWSKKIITAAVFILIIQTLEAQHHSNFWFRTTLNVPVGKKFKIDTEWQHRRQNSIGNLYMMDKNLMFSFRYWVHYQRNENIKLSLSPFAYFSNYKIIQKQSDENALPNNEFRFSAAVELQHAVLKKIFVMDRTAIEYRIFDNNTSNIKRLRNRFGFRYEFNDKTKLSIFDELLFQFSGTSSNYFFDQERIGLNFEYKVLTNLKFDIGYNHITRLPITSLTKLHENNILLNLTYQVNKLTQKK